MIEGWTTARDEVIPAGAVISDVDLEEALGGLIGEDLSLRNRDASRYSSTHRIERVSVETRAGPLELVCKYGIEYSDRLSGHRRGVGYESIMYDRLFPDPDLTTPHCHGVFQSGVTGRCLVLEFIPGFRASSTPSPSRLSWVCRDLALLHARGGRRLPKAHNVFDRAHFTRVAGELTTLGPKTGKFRGLVSRLDDSMQTVIDVLSDVPGTIIHGELYPANVIINDSGAVVIDWENAGVGPGVLDLAVLTQGSWDPDLVAECEDIYWQHCGLTDWERTRESLVAARIFAAIQLLLHLQKKETDGTQEATAIESIGSQLALLTGSGTR